jgi:farnesyl diphosphate synthase
MDAEALQFHAILSQLATRAEAALDGLLPPGETTLGAAMRHAALGGGKRLRAFLAMESAAMFRVPPGQALRTAAAVECIHAYSLVHDDLPCMDDDDLRRGRPTVHRRWDETTAVLAGDALQSLAFELVAGCRCPAEARLELVRTLAVASGVRGMVGGQAMDIAAESARVPLTLAQITALQDGKTGALFRWSATVGPRMAGADTRTLDSYAGALGLAFQIADDILDVEGSEQAVGKATGKDAEAGKATFVTLLGLEPARRRAGDLVDEACEALACYGPEAERLRDAARFVIGRDR